MLCSILYATFRGIRRTGSRSGSNQLVIQVVPIGGSDGELRVVRLDGGAQRRVRTMTGDMDRMRGQLPR